MKRLLVFLSLLFAASFAASGALKFNGNQTAGDAFQEYHDLDFTNSITLSTWITKERSTGGAIWCKIPSASHTTIHFMLGVSNTIRFAFANPSGTKMVYTTDNEVSNITNKYRHIACSFTFGDGLSMRIYLDGVLQTGAWGVGNSNAFALPNDFNCSIGGSLAVAGFGVHAGEVNEVAGWNTTLNPTQIAMLYKCGVKGFPLQIRPDAIKAYWGLDGSPNRTPIGGTYTFPDRTSVHTRNSVGAFEGLGTQVWQMAERNQSYQPNE